MLCFSRYCRELSLVHPVQRRLDSFSCPDLSPQRELSRGQGWPPNRHGFLALRYLDLNFVLRGCCAHILFLVFVVLFFMCLRILSSIMWPARILDLIIMGGTFIFLFHLLNHPPFQCSPGVHVHPYQHSPAQRSVPHFVTSSWA